MDRNAELLNLISLIYDAVERPEIWNAFLEQFARTIGGQATTLLMYSPEGRTGEVHAETRLDPAAKRRYVDYYVGIDPWGVHGSHLLFPGRVLTGQMLCPDHVLEASEFYNDFCRPLDIFHQFCGVIAAYGPSFSVVSSTRPRAAGPFDAAEQWVLKTLLPHLQRAFSLQHRLGGIEAQHRWQAESLDRLPFGVVMLGAHGGVLWQNARARAICDGTDGLSVDADGLRPALPGEAKRLQHLVKGAVEAGLGTGLESGGSMTVTRASGRRAFRLLVSPCRPASFGVRIGGVNGTGAASIFVFDPEVEHENAATKLTDLYSFTPGEARVAALLMHGLSIDAAAQRLGITSSTTRNVVKRLFAKTGTNRQAELVRELLVGPAQVGRD